MRFLVNWLISFIKPQIDINTDLIMTDPSKVWQEKSDSVNN